MKIENMKEINLENKISMKNALKKRIEDLKERYENVENVRFDDVDALIYYLKHNGLLRDFLSKFSKTIDINGPFLQSTVNKDSYDLESACKYVYEITNTFDFDGNQISQKKNKYESYKNNIDKKQIKINYSFNLVSLKKTIKENPDLFYFISTIYKVDREILKQSLNNLLIEEISLMINDVNDGLNEIDILSYKKDSNVNVKEDKLSLYSLEKEYLMLHNLLLTKVSELSIKGPNNFEIKENIKRI